MIFVFIFIFFFFFKQKTAYEISVRDWSSDVCSSDLTRPARPAPPPHARARVSAGRIAAGGPHRRRSAELLSRRGAPDPRRRPYQERGGVAAAAHGGGPGLEPAVGRRAPSLRDVSWAHVRPAAVRLPVAGGAG